MTCPIETKPKKSYAWEALQTFPRMAKEKLIFGHTAPRWAKLAHNYNQLKQALIPHKIDLSKFLTPEGFQGCVLRSNPHPSTCPTVMLCQDPECSKRKPRLEFHSPTKIIFKVGKKTTIFVPSQQP